MQIFNAARKWNPHKTAMNHAPEKGAGLIYALDQWPMWTYLLIVAVISGPWLIPIFNVLLDLGDDNYQYMILGQAIHDGLGFIQLHLPDMPPENLAAPGYPFLLSLIMKIVGHTQPFMAAKVLNVVCYWASAVLCAWAFVRYFRVNRWVALLFSLFMTTNVATAIFASMVLTNSLFILLSTLTIIAFLSYGESGGRASLILAAVFTVAALYIRIPGLPLGVAGFLWIVYRKEYRSAAFYGGFVFFCLSLWLVPMLLQHQWTYIQWIFPPAIGSGEADHFSSVLFRWPKNLLLYLFDRMPFLIFPLLTKPIEFAQTPPCRVAIKVMTGLLLNGLIILEIFAEKKEKKISIIFFFIIVYFVMISVSPVCRARYASYLLPWLFLGCILGLHRFMNIIGLKTRNKIFAGVVCLAVLFGCSLPCYRMWARMMAFNRTQLAAEGGDLASTPWLGDFWSISRPYKMVDAYSWCRDNLPKDAILAGHKIKLGYFYSQRPVLPLIHWAARYRDSHPEPDWPKASKELWQWMLDNNATHVLLDMDLVKPSTVCTYNGIALYPQCFQIVFQAGDPPAYIYEIDRACLEEALNKK